MESKKEAIKQRTRQGSGSRAFVRKAAVKGQAIGSMYRFQIMEFSPLDPQGKPASIDQAQGLWVIAQGARRLWHAVPSSGIIVPLRRYNRPGRMD